MPQAEGRYMPGYLMVGWLVGILLMTIGVAIYVYPSYGVGLTIACIGWAIMFMAFSITMGMYLDS